MRDDSLLFPAIAIFAIIIGFVTWPFIAIFIHELGHALAAKLIGLSLAQLIIGHPDENEPLFSFRSFDCFSGVLADPLRWSDHFRVASDKPS